MAEECYIIEFDSPMGRSSTNILREAGIECIWKGRDGTRGTTTIYLPKIIKQSINVEDVTALLHTISKVSGLSELDELFDSYSKINIKN